MSDRERHGSSFAAEPALPRPRVCFVSFPRSVDLPEYEVATFSPFDFISKKARWGLSELLFGGLNGFYHRRAMYSAAGVDRLYRERNPDYMRLLSCFVDQFRDFDVVVMNTFNFVHPEVLCNELSRPVKIIGMIDDPMSTYTRGLPYLWAFDGAYYISLGYIDGRQYSEAMSRWGVPNATWWPLTNKYDRPVDSTERFFQDRDVDLIYVGNAYGRKVDRLAKLKRHFGRRFRVYGRWQLGGYIGMLRGVLGKPVYPTRVTSLTDEERQNIYYRSKIGLNMHLSDEAVECGNMRTYELPAHGVMQICDKAAGGSHERIFAANTECVYYESVDDAIELIEHYLNDDDARISIASSGFERYWRDYDWNRTTAKFLDWALNLKSNRI